MLDWVDHFEASRLVPQYTINLDANSLEATCWWQYFLIEIGILNAHDRVFRDLLRAQENEGNRRRPNVTM